MKRSAVTILALAAFALATSDSSGNVAAAESAKKVPKDRVVAMYFHRTQRCPTCLKMGGYTEETIKTRFAKQLEDGTIELHYIDFQDKKNAVFAKAYKVTGPALIVARVADGKVAEFKDLKDIWSHVDNKKAFMKYVQDQITACHGKKK